jgi:hypothetical protein
MRAKRLGYLERYPVTGRRPGSWGVIHFVAAPALTEILDAMVARRREQGFQRASRAGVALDLLRAAVGLDADQAAE